MKTLRLIHQPPDSKMCGQACLAMLCGISLEEAVALIGHAHGTKTKEIIQALRILGVKVNSDRLIRIGLRKGGFPTTCLCRVIAFKEDRKALKEIYNWSHWVVLHEGRIYDPAYQRPVTSYGRISAYLEVDLL